MKDTAFILVFTSSKTDRCLIITCLFCKYTFLKMTFWHMNRNITHEDDLRYDDKEKTIKWLPQKIQYLKTYLAIKILRGTRSVLTVFFYCSCVVAFEVSFVIEAVHVSESTGLQRFTLQKITGYIFWRCYGITSIFNDSPINTRKCNNRCFGFFV